jgi:transposase
VLQDHPDTVVLALDEAHVWAQNTLHSGWSLVGQTPVITVESQRYRVVFYGALDLRTGEEHALMTERMNQATTATFLQYLLAQYPTQHLLLLWDQASWHGGQAVAALLAQHPRVEVYALPTACPELNPQEHVWAVMRREVPRAQPFAQRVVAYLACLRRTRFRPLLFEHYAPSILSILNE